MPIRKKSSKSSKSSRSNSIEAEKCASTYCKNVYPKQLEEIKKKMSEKVTNKMTKNFSPSHKKIFIKNFNKCLFKKNKKLKEIENKNCKNMYCNKTCKNTLFEKGNKMSKAALKSFKNHLAAGINNPKTLKSAYKQSVKMLTHIRHNIFGNKKNVLKGNFYEKLSPKTVNKLKKEGAISGCTLKT